MNPSPKRKELAARKTSFNFDDDKGWIQVGECPAGS